MYKVFSSFRPGGLLIVCDPFDELENHQKSCWTISGRIDKR
jgi:hypothetical protein